MENENQSKRYLLKAAYKDQFFEFPSEEELMNYPANFEAKLEGNPSVAKMIKDYEVIMQKDCYNKS